ncbi:MAG: DUF4129 domain-containing protein [Gammaproteobacteria bacterium]|nr:DUF4129 domain-containing protein [Gammaproteobacteria bacterium]
MFLFKLGITVMSINTLAELGCECELGALPIGLVFLLAALAALALERIAPSTQMDVGWTATLMRTLATIFAFAAVAGFLAAQFGGGALSGLGVLWRTLVNWLVSALMFVLGPLLRALFGFIAWLRERLGNNDRDLSDGPFGKLEPFSWSKLPPVERWGESALGFIELALVALFFLILLRIVFSMKRPKANGLWQSQIIERESLRGARESRLAFLKGFLRDLLPDWLVATPSSTSAGMTADRSGPIGLYFDMLRLGIERGHELNRTATPSERIGPLSQALDTAPVREITEDFNHALYGEQPDQGARSEALRKDLLQSSARPDTE